jgi:glycosidase
MVKIKGLSLILFTFIIVNTSNGSPEWSKDAIWYQIFPERFRNGDISNDPTIETLNGTWPFDPVEEWQISPWGSDWYKMQKWELKTGKDFYYVAQRRRYGGDIQGIIDKLDYLEDLGVNALYLNPVFESPSLHKYGATLLHHIDNNFGPNPELDLSIWNNENPASPEEWKWTSADKLFLELIKECHSRGMKIIIDGVFNHVGLNFWALNDVRKNGISSPYANWFTVKKWDDPSTKENEFECEGWSGFMGLPEFKKTNDDYPKDLKSYFHAVVQRWMDPNNDGNPEDGIDGWRLDVAAEVPIKFWKEFRQWVKDINPEAYITGEIWWEDYKNNKLKNAAKWIKGGDVFDGVMNYRFADSCYQYFIQPVNPLNAAEFSKEITKIHNDYGYDVSLGLQNLLNSHDTQRLASMVQNPRHRLDHGANLKSNKNYSVAPLAKEKHSQLDQILAFQFLSPGAPYVYYGDEVGMWGADDPDCRKPMIWDDIIYDPEYELPFAPKRNNGFKVSQDKNRFNFIKKLCSIRKNNPSLRRGNFKILVTDNDNQIFAFTRKYKENECLAVFNSSPQSQKMPSIPYNMHLKIGSLGTTKETIKADGFALFIK